MVAVVFGGRSPEHEISLLSAENIIGALDAQKYEVLPIGISKAGKWLHHPDVLQFLKNGELNGAKEIFLSADPSRPGIYFTSGSGAILGVPDVIIPVLHGPFGEDGSLQGLLELSGIPFVGCGALASAIGMDKAVQKEIFRAAGIPVVPAFSALRKNFLKEKQPVADRAASLGFPIFVKPANMGSSVGVHKVKTASELYPALEDAFRYDTKILIERAVPFAREIECAVLGNDNPKASALGEIMPSSEFYDYNAKYIDGKSESRIPAQLPEEISVRVRDAALTAFKAICASGLSRADFLLNGETMEFFLNEVNTFPGFTSISMYPKLWEAEGMSASELVGELIKLAFEKAKEGSEISRVFLPS